MVEFNIADKRLFEEKLWHMVYTLREVWGVLQTAELTAAERLDWEQAEARQSERIIEMCAMISKADEDVRSEPPRRLPLIQRACLPQGAA